MARLSLLGKIEWKAKAIGPAAARLALVSPMALRRAIPPFKPFGRAGKPATLDAH